MALTFWRWCACLVVGCVLLGSLVSRPLRSLATNSARALVDEPAYARYALQLKAYDTVDHATRTTAEVMRAIELRDSVRARLTGRENGITVHVSDAFPEIDRRFADSVLRVLWAKVLTGPPRVPVVISVFLDSSNKVRGAPRSERYQTMVRSVVPMAGSPAPCLVILAVPRDLGPRPTPLRSRAMSWTQSGMGRMAGPCAYAARYGAPGRGIHAWMYANRTWFEDLVWIGGDRPAPGSSPRPGLPVRPARNYDAGPAGFRCIRGEDTSCTRVATGLMGLGEWTPSDSVAGIAPEGERARAIMGMLGQESGRLVLDMRNALRDEGFEKMWRSDSDLPKAFRDASGRELSTWTREWAISKYGPDQSGSMIPLAGVGMALLEAAALIGLTLLVAERRRLK